MFSIGLITVIFVKTRIPVIRAYLLWYLSFSVVTITDILFAYIETNLPVREQLGLILLFFVNLIMIYLFMFTLPLFSHELYNLASRKRRNFVVGLIVFGTYIAFHGLTWLNAPSWQSEKISFFCPDLPLTDQRVCFAAERPTLSAAPRSATTGHGRVNCSAYLLA